MNQHRLARVLVMASALALAAGEGAGASTGKRCVVAWVPSYIVLPDGSAHPPGLLRLCNTHVLSPVSSLHEMAMDGAPVGLLAGRAFRAEGGPLERPVVFFRRERTGDLRLVGYVVPTGKGSVAFDLSGEFARRAAPRPLAGATVTALAAAAAVPATAR